MKTYTITGACWYMTNFTIEVEAKNKKEAQEQAKLQSKEVQDPVMSECVEVQFDEPYLEK